MSSMSKCLRSSRCKVTRYSSKNSKKNKGKIKRDCNNCNFFKKICIDKEAEKMKVIIITEIKRVMVSNYKMLLCKQARRLTIASKRFIPSKKEIT